MAAYQWEIRVLEVLVEEIVVVGMILAERNGARRCDTHIAEDAENFAESWRIVPNKVSKVMHQYVASVGDSTPNNVGDE